MLASAACAHWLRFVSPNSVLLLLLPLSGVLIGTKAFSFVLPLHRYCCTAGSPRHFSPASNNNTAQQRSPSRAVQRIVLLAVILLQVGASNDQHTSNSITHALKQQYDVLSDCQLLHPPKASWLTVAKHCTGGSCGSPCVNFREAGTHLPTRVESVRAYEAASSAPVRPCSMWQLYRTGQASPEGTQGESVKLVA
jgi:hypothetical protein